MTAKQRFVLAQYRGRMRTKRLRKKLLKYPERYAKLRTFGELYEFEYMDAVESSYKEMMTGRLLCPDPSLWAPILTPFLID